MDKHFPEFDEYVMTAYIKDGSEPTLVSKHERVCAILCKDGHFVHLFEASIVSHSTDAFPLQLLAHAKNEHLVLRVAGRCRNMPGYDSVHAQVVASDALRREVDWIPDNLANQNEAVRQQSKALIEQLLPSHEPLSEALSEAFERRLRAAGLFPVVLDISAFVQLYRGATGVRGLARVLTSSLFNGDWSRGGCHEQLFEIVKSSSITEMGRSVDHMKCSSSCICDPSFPFVAEALVKDKQPGVFVVRDSTSYRGCFGLVMKVESESPASISPTASPAGSLVTI